MQTGNCDLAASSATLIDDFGLGIAIVKTVPGSSLLKNKEKNERLIRYTER